ncbi:subtilisin-like protease SBT3.10 [Oryza sativa Japonica Group]
MAQGGAHRGGCCLLLFLVLLALSLRTSCVVGQQSQFKKIYIIYLGERRHDDPDIVTGSHHDMLASVLGSKEASLESTVYMSYRHSFSGFAAKCKIKVLTKTQASMIRGLPEVLSVRENRIHQMHTSRSWDFLGMDYMQPNSLLAKANYGDDIIIGVIDSGITPESPSFADDGYGPPPSKWKGICQVGPSFEGKSCNRKLIGARWYIDDDNLDSMSKNEILSPRDVHGHGMHMASTAGGNIVHNASIFGLATGTVRGGAPCARVAMYKACWSGGGCSTAGQLKAMDDAVHDGVDILSLSIGGPFENYGTLHVVAKGIPVVYSAGNDGPITQTVENSSPWLLTVTAATMDRSFPVVITLGNNDKFVAQSFATLSQFSEIQFYEREDCNAENINSTVKGKIVFCFFGTMFDPEPDYYNITKATGEKGGIGVILPKYCKDGFNVDCLSRFHGCCGAGAGTGEEAEVAADSCVAVDEADEVDDDDDADPYDGGDSKTASAWPPWIGDGARGVVGGEADVPRGVDGVRDESAVPGEADTAGDRGASRGAEAGESTSGGAPVPALPPAGGVRMKKKGNFRPEASPSIRMKRHERKNTLIKVRGVDLFVAGVFVPYRQLVEFTGNVVGGAGIDVPVELALGPLLIVGAAATALGSAAAAAEIAATATTSALATCSATSRHGSVRLSHALMKFQALLKADQLGNDGTPKVKISLTQTTIGKVSAPKVAAFSSRGPSYIYPGVIKPDIAAPGVTVLAAAQKAFMDAGILYHFDSGTSMSCHHVSGIIAVLKSLHPQWSPAALKSAIMTTALTYDNNGMPIQANGKVSKITNPFDYGAGFVNPNMAADPGLIYDIEPSDYFKFFNCMGGLGSGDNCTTVKGSLADLNLPSIAIPNPRTFQATMRTVTNVGQANAVYKAFLQPPTGVEMTVNPSVLVFSKEKKVLSFKVTFKAMRRPIQGDYIFGSLTWHDGGSHWVQISIAVRIVIEDIYSKIS